MFSNPRSLILVTVLILPILSAVCIFTHCLLLWCVFAVDGVVAAFPSVISVANASPASKCAAYAV